MIVRIDNTVFNGEFKTATDFGGLICHTIQLEYSEIATRGGGGYLVNFYLE